MTEPGKQRERLERILAELEAGRAVPGAPKGPGAPDGPGAPRASAGKGSASRPARSRLGGLFDLLAVSAAFYTLVVATPVGGLLERGFHWALGHKVHTRALVSYFRAGGEGGAPQLAVKEMAQETVASAPTTAGAQAAGLDPEVARAVALILSGGAQVQGAFDVHLPPAAAASFAAVGAPRLDPAAAVDVRQAAMLSGLGRLQAELSNPQAAVAALAVELPRVRYALQRAKAAQVAEPDSYAAFRAFLPPDDRAEADPLVNGTFALVVAFGMGWPVPDETRISSPFGERVHPVLGTTKKHTGVDLAVASGSEVRAIAAGRVRTTAIDGVNGRYIKLDHGFGLTSTYCHNSTLEVGRGQRVDKGALVATSGASGRVSGPHLHFQMELDGVPVDPQLFWHPKPKPKAPAE